MYMQSVMPSRHASYVGKLNPTVRTVGRLTWSASNEFAGTIRMFPSNRNMTMMRLFKPLTASHNA